MDEYVSLDRWYLVNLIQPSLYECASFRKYRKRILYNIIHSMHLLQSPVTDQPGVSPLDEKDSFLLNASAWKAPTYVHRYTPILIITIIIWIRFYTSFVSKKMTYASSLWLRLANGYSSAFVFPSRISNSVLLLDLFDRVCSFLCRVL